MIPLEFVKGILTEFKKYKISSKTLDFVFFVIPQVIVVVVVLPYIAILFFVVYPGHIPTDEFCWIIACSEDNYKVLVMLVRDLFLYIY